MDDATALRTRLDELLDRHRHALAECLDGLTEEEARARLVPSATTLLGLVKHLTFVERFWFDHAITGRSLREIGVASTPARSFVLRRDDTVASIRAAYVEACEAAREQAATLALDDEVTGRGTRTLWSIYLHMLQEVAHHHGHVDILREQVLARRDDVGTVS